MASYVKVIAREEAVDKNKTPYAKLKVEEKIGKLVVDPETGEEFFAKSSSKITSFNAWSKKPFSDDPDFGWELKVGDTILGRVVTEKVEEYEIEREGEDPVTVDLYTCLIQGDTDHPTEFQAEIEKQFRKNGRSLSANGETKIASSIKLAAAQKEFADKETA